MKAAVTPTHTPGLPGTGRDPELALFVPDSRDRRARVRFPIQLPFLYRLGRRVQTGSGWTLNLSSRGVLAGCGNPLPVGALIELTISWPFLLEGVIPVDLIVTGHITRCHGSLFAVVFSRHDFQPAEEREAAGDSSGPPIVPSAPRDNLPCQINEGHLAE